ncbi:hypothetical protein FRC11_012291, partial [Ceratobasidium sp. 423]
CGDRMMNEESKIGTESSDLPGEAQGLNQTPQSKTQIAAEQTTERYERTGGEPSGGGLKTDDLSHEEWYELGRSHRHKFRRFGVLNDIENAIEYGRRALDLTPVDHPNLPLQHTGLGASYSDRFRRLGNLNDLEKALEHNSRALELTPDGHPDLSDRHANLGVSYTNRFQHLGNIDDLAKAFEHNSRALELTPDGHPDLSDRHASLGVSYTDRFQHLGNIDDLAKALEHDSRALELTPDGHPDLSRRHASLGVSYTDRFQHLGNIDDLEKALEHNSRALELTPDGHPDLSRLHASLGVSYTDRFRHLGNTDDLAKALEHKSRALELTPDGHPDLSDRHASLGVSYTDRFRHLGNIDDLAKALEHDSRALELTPDGHPDLSRRHASLGVSYTDRFQHLGNIDDLEKALEHDSRALELTPDSHPDLSRRHHNQALSYFHHYRHTNNPDQLQQSLHSFRRASQVEAAPPRQQFRDALQWAALASEHSSLMPIEAYRAAIHLLPQFIWLGATTVQRYQHLLTVGNLAVKAAYAAILHSHFDLALEWLEHGRCVVWNQSLMLRAPLDQLHSSHPELAARLEAVSKQLDDASSAPPACQMFTSSSIDPEQVGRQRHLLAAEYDDILTDVHELPGFEDFLRPIKANVLVQVTRNGPVVVINCHEDHCDALLILPGEDDIKHLALPNFTEKKARNARSELERCLRRKGIRQRGFKPRQPPGSNDSISRVLLHLWEDVVKPILDFLGLS